MIKTLIFDFGDVFINLDKEGAMKNALTLFELNELPEDLVAINILYEQGLISTDEFLSFYTDNFPNLTKVEIIDAWNFILRDFPVERLKFLKTLSEENKYKLILLSNTNELHISWIKDRIPFYEKFKSYFDAFYLSHEINLRKPNTTIYQYVLKENNLNPQECLFIDDTKENTKAAAKLGVHVWNIDETQEDILDLFTINNHLF
ncbi:HAD family phosphatase [uncultured Psychroserpens sp.]|uniref:HAD family hydrolase n=1 Tax=uncultured Psychroserpens sp. TaxID=255436 RepID=UPI00261618B1|nr:HAD family phosphatase [uncultured Psychroserpens sp.]